MLSTRAIIVDCAHVHHVVRYKVTRTYHYLFVAVDYTYVGSAIASFEDLVTLHRRTQQQVFWERIHYGFLCT